MAQLTELSAKAIKALKKYKYAGLVLLLGIALLLLPGKKQTGTAEPQSTPTQQEPTDDEYVALFEERLTSMLSQISGAGRVQVMLTLQTGSRTLYQTDRQYSETLTDTDTQRSEEQKTVILSEGSTYDKAAVSAVDYPQFQGALIISEGADAAAVKLDLINAVTALTGLKSDQITVVKMK